MMAITQNINGQKKHQQVLIEDILDTSSMLYEDLGCAAVMGEKGWIACCHGSSLTNQVPL